VPPRQPLALRLVVALALVALAGHVAVNLLTSYEFHRDEFLYLAMGRHLRLWAMDFPPLIAIVARVERAILGDSLAAIRLVPAIAAAALVALSAVIARELGGGRFAQGLAALCVLASPLFLRAGNLFQPVVLDQLWWTLALLALVRLGHEEMRGGSRWWIVLGAAGGLGLLTKFSIIFLGLALLAALLATAGGRRALGTRGPWLAALLALLLGLPSLVGQIRLGLPVLGQMRDLRSTQLERVGPTEFLGGQLLLGPAVALAAAGLVWLLRAREAAPYRVLGWSCLAAFLLLLALQGKAYYVGPVYPALWGAGAAALDRWRSSGAAARSLRVAAVALVALFGLVALPFGVPILPPPQMARYAATMGVGAAVTTNWGARLALPQDYADMLGWKEMVAAVAAQWRTLPWDTQHIAALYAENYGQAGALDFYGPRHGLPPAVSAAGSYWFFGPGTREGDPLVAVGVSASDLNAYYRRVVPMAVLPGSPWAVPSERDVPLNLALGSVRTLREIWPELAGRN
jgi:4-amino-4-deoxy-L-arabinose transferase-like glycosyltransferase